MTVLLVGYNIGYTNSHIKLNFDDNSKLRIGFVPDVGGLHFNEAGEPVGFYYDLINKVLERMGLDYYMIIIDPRHVDHAALLKRIDAGDFDILVGITAGKKWKNNLIFAPPMLTLGLSYITSTQNIRALSWPAGYKEFPVSCITWQLSCKFAQRRLMRSTILYNDLRELFVGVDLNIDKIGLIKHSDAEYLSHKTVKQVIILNEKPIGKLNIDIGFSKYNKLIFKDFSIIYNQLRQNKWYKNRLSFWYEDYTWVNDKRFDSILRLANTYHKRHFSIVQR